MRGLYSARFLKYLANTEPDNNDLGKKFDLIAGTSTGAILGCALAKNIDLDKVIALYRQEGQKIFPKQFPSGKIKMLLQRRSKLNAKGDKALRAALENVLGNTTFKQIYEERGIALAITSIDLESNSACVFKTPHNEDTNGRDNNRALVDACMATSAAPVFRSLAVLNDLESNAPRMFVDGGLWANNPVLVSLVEALRHSPPEIPIHIYSLGTLSLNSGGEINPMKPHWGIMGWDFGAKGLLLSMDVQSKAQDDMARMLAKEINREVKIIRFPEPEVSSKQEKYLSLDATSEEACDFLERKAQDAFNMLGQLRHDTNSVNAHLIDSLLRN